ncbi:winged helix-turn-helix transcriptional regulator [Nocardiopsis sediminis]|uniref:Winged helix-turn-helix transcriptional regulator n=1 Tax=Nocardiopsis sediminis TaxID=1778267 RepID=A0ABV8FKL3_9ACTN
MEDLSPYCPRYSHAAAFLGRRWMFAVVRALMAGSHRYTDIRAGVPGVTDRILTERLRDLEAEGIVRRDVRSTSPVRVEYRLTDKGRAMTVVVTALQDWADAWVDLPCAEPGPARPASGAAARG